MTAQAERIRAALDRHGAERFVAKLLERAPRVTWDELAEPLRRWPHVVYRRHEVWALLHGTLGLGFAELGRVFGVDHTTVMNGVAKRVARLA